MQSKTKGFEEILERFPSRDRIHFFLLFVLLSLSFWVSTKLSNSYQVDQDFYLVWSKPPKGIILVDDDSKLIFFLILPVNGGSELKSDFYKNILEFFKASFCFYVKFCN